MGNRGSYTLPLASWTSYLPHCSILYTLQYLACQPERVAITDPVTSCDTAQLNSTKNLSEGLLVQYIVLYRAPIIAYNTEALQRHCLSSTGQ